ncbi:hypothetical protein RP20_CCG017157 [Aedes albopictus]|nr:hypothetical protein RP20_CCG017157 [Aedes albopictus]
MCCVCPTHTETEYEKLVEHSQTLHGEKRDHNRKAYQNRKCDFQCPVCLKVFDQKAKLVRHQRRNRTFFCTGCAKSVLNTERLSHKTCAQKVKCELCGKLFVTDQNLRIHLKNLHSGNQEGIRKSVCSVCGKAVLNLKAHMASHENKRSWECNICHARFNLFPVYVMHQRVHDGLRNYACRQGCDKRYKASGDRDRHEKLVHLGIRPFGCDLCESSFVRERDLRLHVQRHTGRKLYPCDQCQAGFDRKTDFEEHVKEHTGQSRVPGCAYRTKYKGRMNTHIVANIHRNAEGIKVNPRPPKQPKQPDTRFQEPYPQEPFIFMCCVCPTHTETEYEKLIEHGQTLHEEKRDHNRRTYQNRKCDFQCPVCLKVFDQKATLVRHQRRTRTFFCNGCAKWVHNTEKLSHKTCARPRKVKCEICDKLFLTDRYLRSHLKTVHSKNREERNRMQKTVCPVCGKLMRNLQAHMAIHENQRSWECNICHARFNLYELCVRHQRVHDGLRNFACRQGCDKRYKASGDRDRHEKQVHLGIMPFGCDLCESSFVRERDLRLHMRKHTGQKLYPCDQCQASFDRKTDFEEHVKEHTGQRRIAERQRTLDDEHTVADNAIHHEDRPLATSKPRATRANAPGTATVTNTSIDAIQANIIRWPFADASKILIEPHRRTQVRPQPRWSRPVNDLDELISLHCRCASHQDKLLVEMITEVTRLDTFDRKADTLPQHICSQCLTRLDAAYSFLRIAKDASAALDRSGDRCQICLRDAVDELISMFCVSASDGQLIVDMLRDVCGVSCLEEDDDQQKYVCRECFGLLSGVYSFRNMLLESDTSWRQTLELENDLTNDTVEIGDPIKIEPMEVHDEDILITSTRETRNAYLQKQAKIKDDEAGNACAEASTLDSSPKLPAKNDKNEDPFIYLDSAEVDVERLKPLLFTQENAEYYDQLLFKGIICCCRKLLRDHGEWQTHCKEIHSDSAEETVTTSSAIECKICHRKFKSASQYKEHTQSRQKNIFYRCKICNIITRERSALADHFEFTRFHPIFHNSETVRSYFEERVETSYESSGDCCGCGEQFESGKALLEHTKAVHYPLGDDRPTFQCLVCYTSFANKQSLYKHQLAYSTTKTYRCRKAKCAFQSIGLSAEIKKHIESDKHHFKPTEFFCCFYGCYETFGSNQALEQHCVEDHAEQRINNGRFSANATSNVCWLCNRQLATDKAYREHLRGQYDRKYVCSTCGRKFISHAGVVQHEKDTHLVAETRSFPCDRCSKTFSKQIYLTKHIRTVHDNICTESCSFCEKRFVNKRALKEHIKNKHMEEKPYKCTECSMTFGNRFNLRRHLTTHSTERPHTCSHCGNTYRYQSDMKRHIDAIHLDNKPFACQVCDARFIRTRDLQVHMMRHTKTKLYKCSAPDCDYSTNSRKTLDEHLLEHYNGMICV